MKAYGVPDSAITPAKLSSALQDKVPYLTVTVENQTTPDGTGNAYIQAYDAAGNELHQRFRVRTWISSSDFGAPVKQDDFSVAEGTELREIDPDADYEVISDHEGYVFMTITVATDRTVYVMAEIDGRIYSGSVEITGN